MAKAKYRIVTGKGTKEVEGELVGTFFGINEGTHWLGGVQYEAFALTHRPTGVAIGTYRTKKAAREVALEIDRRVKALAGTFAPTDAMAFNLDKRKNSEVARVLTRVPGLIDSIHKAGRASWAKGAKKRVGGKVSSTRGSRRMTVAVDDFIDVLSSKLTQYDARLEKRQPNLYRLGHYLKAVDKVRKEMKGRLRSVNEGAIVALRASIESNFIVSDMPPARAVVKQIDAYLAKGTAPTRTARTTKTKKPTGLMKQLLGMAKGAVRKYPPLVIKRETKGTSDDRWIISTAYTGPVIHGRSDDAVEIIEGVRRVKARLPATEGQLGDDARYLKSYLVGYRVGADTKGIVGVARYAGGSEVWDLKTRIKKGRDDPRAEVRDKHALKAITERGKDIGLREPELAAAAGLTEGSTARAIKSLQKKWLIRQTASGGWVRRNEMIDDLKSLKTILGREGPLTLVSVGEENVYFKTKFGIPYYYKGGADDDRVLGLIRGTKPPRPKATSTTKRDKHPVFRLTPPSAGPRCPSKVYALPISKTHRAEFAVRLREHYADPSQSYSEAKRAQVRKRTDDQLIRGEIAFQFAQFVKAYRRMARKEKALRKEGSWAHYFRTEILKPFNEDVVWGIYDKDVDDGAVERTSIFKAWDECLRRAAFKKRAAKRRAAVTKGPKTRRKPAAKKTAKKKPAKRAATTKKTGKKRSTLKSCASMLGKRGAAARKRKRELSMKEQGAALRAALRRIV